MQPLAFIKSDGTLQFSPEFTKELKEPAFPFHNGLRRGARTRTAQRTTNLTNSNLSGVKKWEPDQGQEIRDRL
eukprot:scaffold28476_cov107-Isochrysis_galbana.AAC.1